MGKGTNGRRRRRRALVSKESEKDGEICGVAALKQSGISFKKKTTKKQKQTKQGGVKMKSVSEIVE